MADKLDEYLSLLSRHVEPRDARKQLRITDKALDAWLQDPKIRTRIEAAQRGVAPPEVSDVDRLSDVGSGGFPWERYTHDPIGRLRAIEIVLSSSGFHPMSPFWDEQFELFYKSKKLQFTGRIGRRGGKSSDVCRAAVSEVVGTERALPPGESGTCPIISHTMPEANDRLDTIEAIIKALAFRQVEKIPEEFGTYQRTTELGRKLIRTLDVKRNVVEWVVFPASINGVSGFTAICALCDEASKWRDDKTGANPASVVLASLRPCFATQPDAHLYLISSAFSTIDAHHDAIEEGDTDIQYLVRLGERGACSDIEQRMRAVHAFETQAQLLEQQGKQINASIATRRAKSLRDSVANIDPLSPNISTWVANPSLTIERTLLLEADFATWLREYASIPTGSGSTYFFDHQTIDRCNVMIVVKRVPKKRGVGIDPGLVTNSFAACAWGLDEDGAWLLDALEIMPSPGSPLDDEESFTECAEFARRNESKIWATDGHYIATARRIGAKYKIATILAPNDNGKTFTDFRREAGRGRISIAGHALSIRVARQLKMTMSQAMAGARTKIVLAHEAGGAHGDVASAAIRGWWLVSSGSHDRSAAFGSTPEPMTQ